MNGTTTSQPHSLLLVQFSRVLCTSTTRALKPRTCWTHIGPQGTYCLGHRVLQESCAPHSSSFPSTAKQLVGTFTARTGLQTWPRLQSEHDLRVPGAVRKWTICSVETRTSQSRPGLRSLAPSPFLPLGPLTTACAQALIITKTSGRRENTERYTTHCAEKIWGVRSKWILQKTVLLCCSTGQLAPH